MQVDVIQMLFVKGDKAGFAASKPLRCSLGSHWSYSSGTSNIIARVLGHRFASRLSAEPLGMRVRC